MSLDTFQRRLTAGGTPDPSADAATVQRSAGRRQADERHRRRLREAWEEFREDVEYMAAHGETVEGAARRMGTSVSAMEYRFRRWGVPMPAFPGDYALQARGAGNPLLRSETRGGSRLTRTN